MAVVMRIFWRILLALLALILFVLGYRFAADNALAISLTWGSVDSLSLPLFVWLAGFLLSGYLLGLLTLAIANLRLSIRLRQTRRDLERLRADKGIRSTP
jgi:uncharacterized integral membrane protein